MIPRQDKGYISLEHIIVPKSKEVLKPTNNQPNDNNKNRQPMIISVAHRRQTKALLVAKAAQFDQKMKYNWIITQNME